MVLSESLVPGQQPGVRYRTSAQSPTRVPGTGVLETCVALYAPFEGSLTRREPRSNPKRRSAQSIFALQIPPGRQSRLNSPLVCPAKHPVLVRTSDLRCCQSPSTLDALAAPWRASASPVLLPGTGTPTADVLARVNNHRRSEV